MKYKTYKKLTSINHTALKRSKKDIKFIVCHYVGALGDSKPNAEYYASTYVGASADFYVGFTGERWQGNDYYNFYSWHCGGGYQSSWRQNGGGAFYGQCTNRNSVGIEMCVHKKNTKTMNATDTDWYFEEATIDSTAELVASLMKEFGLDINHVLMHYSVNAKICPNPFVIDNPQWEAFKKRVLSYYNGESVVYYEPDWFRVGLGWKSGKCTGQLGAYEVYENAVNNCPAGYMVFDVKGNVLYQNRSSAGTQSSEFNGLSEKEAAAKILELARAEGVRAHILPSLIAAQAILESGYCRTTELVRKSNNCFGMKCSLSNNGWRSVWDGVSKVNIRTPEQDKNGNQYYIYADFRKYPSIEKSFEDHSCYLLGAMNGNKKRYAGLTNCKGYREAITLVKNGGYATDVNYVSKLCSIVERYGLDKYDGEVTKLSPAAKEPEKQAAGVVYRVQLGAYEVKGNAEAAARQAKSNGFDTFTETEGRNNCVYAGSYAIKANADKRLREVKAGGFKNAFIKEVRV